MPVYSSARNWSTQPYIVNSHCLYYTKKVEEKRKDGLTQQKKLELPPCIALVPPELAFDLLVDTFLLLGLFRQAARHSVGWRPAGPLGGCTGYLVNNLLRLLLLLCRLFRRLLPPSLLLLLLLLAEAAAVAAAASRGSRWLARLALSSATASSSSCERSYSSSSAPRSCCAAGFGTWSA